MVDDPKPAIGCAGLPAGLRRDRFFEKLDFLEATETFAQAPGLKNLRKWRQDERARYGLVADQRISHTAAESNQHDSEDPLASQWGGFRDTPAVREAVDDSVERASVLQAETVLFRSASSFSPSAQNRDTLKHFFTEIVGQRFGSAHLVWEPGGLWEFPVAAKLAGELGLVVAVDGLAEDPHGGTRPRPVDQVPRNVGYLRQRGLGRQRGFKNHHIEDLAAIASEFERCYVVFAHNEKNRDAKALRRMLAG